MNGVEKAAEVLAAHTDDGCGDCICSEYVLDGTLAAHVAQALADAGLLADEAHDGCVGQDLYDTATTSLATLREDVAREIEAQPWSRPYEVAAEIAARIARGTQ